MTAQPMSTSLAKVRKLLPVKLESTKTSVRIVDRDGRTFCVVPFDADKTMTARAELIRDAMNGMA